VTPRSNIVFARGWRNLAKGRRLGDRRENLHLKFHGNTRWQAFDLILLAVVWVWSGDAALTGAFVEARQWSLQVLGRAAVTTFQGLLKALVTWTAEPMPLWADRLPQLMQEHGGTHWRILQKGDHLRRMPLLNGLRRDLTAALHDD
jgi:hypothetical protein